MMKVLTYNKAALLWAFYISLSLLKDLKENGESFYLQSTIKQLIRYNGVDNWIWIAKQTTYCFVFYRKNNR